MQILFPVISVPRD